MCYFFSFSLSLFLMMVMLGVRLSFHFYWYHCNHSVLTQTACIIYFIDVNKSEIDGVPTYPTSHAHTHTVTHTSIKCFFASEVFGLPLVFTLNPQSAWGHSYFIEIYHAVSHCAWLRWHKMKALYKMLLTAGVRDVPGCQDARMPFSTYACRDTAIHSSVFVCTFEMIDVCGQVDE